MEKGTFKTTWSAVDQGADPALLLQFMDTFGVVDAEEARKRYEHTFHFLRLQADLHVLEVGCGRGIMAQAIAQEVGSQGHVIGIDKSVNMIAAARQRQKVSSSPVQFRVGDAEHLPFATDTFDRCYSGGMLEVVPNPYIALQEMVRVLKPGGWLVASAPDYGTTALDTSYIATTRKLLAYFCDHELHGLIGRQLLGMCRQLGLTHITASPQTSIIADYQQFQQLMTSSVWIGRAQAAGMCSAKELAEWWRDLDARAQEERFFCAISYFLVAGQKALQE